MKQTQMFYDHDRHFQFCFHQEELTIYNHEGIFDLYQQGKLISRFYKEKNNEKRS